MGIPLAFPEQYREQCALHDEQMRQIVAVLLKLYHADRYFFHNSPGGDSYITSNTWAGELWQRLQDVERALQAIDK